MMNIELKLEPYKILDIVRRTHRLGSNMNHTRYKILWDWHTNRLGSNKGSILFAHINLAAGNLVPVFIVIKKITIKYEASGHKRYLAGQKGQLNIYCWPNGPEKQSNVPNYPMKMG